MVGKNCQQMLGNEQGVVSNVRKMQKVLYCHHKP